MKKQKLFIVLTLVFISVILSSIFITSELTKQRIAAQFTDQYSQQGKTLASETATILKTEVTSIQDKLNLIALIPEIRDGSTAVCQSKLEEAFRVLGDKVGNLGRVNSQGIFQCSLNKKLIGIKAETLGKYILNIFNDPAHKPVLSRAIKPVGSTSFIQAVHVPVYSSKGEFIGTVGGAIYFDELEKKILQKIKLTDNGTIVILDDDGTIIYHPNAFLRGKSVDSEDVVKLSQTSGAHRSILNDALKNQRGQLRFTFDNVDNVAAYESVEIIPGRNWVVLVTTPIADINKNVAAVGLNRLFYILFTILATITILGAVFFAGFLLRQFARIDKAKDEFISIASHQLRTPLTAIRLYSEILAKKPYAQSDPDLKEDVGIIHTSTLRMIKLVGDILNVSRIQIGSLKVDPQPTLIERLIKSVVDEAKPTASLKKVDIATDFPESQSTILNIDETLIRQVIHNLLTNAIRYTKPGVGKITINAVPKNNGVEILIADNGIGIPIEAQDKIFSRFFRAENAIKHDGDGTGLGMYMAKMIMDIARGSITFKSAEGKGTAFTVFIPKNGMIRTTGTTSLN